MKEVPAASRLGLIQQLTERSENPMDFVVGLVKVVIGAFLLFTVARIAYASMVPSREWAWVILLGFLALANMLFHRWLGGSINPPFFTAALFAVSLAGLAPDQTVLEGPVSGSSRWFRRGLVAIAAGTAVGWLTFGQIVTHA